MSIGAGSAICTASPGSERSASSTRAAPGERVAGDLDAHEAPARARVRDEGQRARRARRGARILGPGAVEIERHARAQLGRRPEGDHAAVVEVDEPLARLGLVEIAGADHDQRRAAALLEQLPDLAARHHVDARRRLVEQQHARARVSSAFEIASFCFMPPESAPAGRSAKGGEPRALEQLGRARAPDAAPRAGAAAP